MKIERHRADVGGMTVGSATGRWTYSDSAVHLVALRLLLLGINVAEIDDWIEGETWDDATQLERVLAWRRRMLCASSMDAAEGWGMFLLELRYSNRREDFLHPLAKVGHQWQGKLPAPGERKTVRAPLQTTLQVKARNERIVKLAAAGKSPDEIGRMLEPQLTGRHVRRIIKLQTA